LNLTDVTVSRGQKRILNRLSLRVPRFQHTAILGPNGSGKSSLQKVLIRQFYPSVDDGQTDSVTIFGQSNRNISDLRKRLGIVSSELDHEFCSPEAAR